MKLKFLFQWLARRSAILFTTLLFGGVIFLIWILIAGVSFSEKTTTTIAAISIFFAAVSAFANLLQAVEVQKQREEQERPYIIVYFEASNSGAFYCVIENVGNSPAYDLRIKFTPSPIDYANRPINEISLFANPISFLPSEKSIRQIIGAAHQLFEDNKPTKFSATVGYRSVYGEFFSEKIEHDLEYLRHTTLPRKMTNDYLKEVSEHMKSIVRSLDKLSASTKLPSSPKSKTKK